MSTATIACTGYVNDASTGYDCRIVITRDVHVETSTSPKFDEWWSFTDAAGHFHAYDQTEDRGQSFPTLRERLEKIPCGYSDHDVDCGGENITHYHCRICDEEIKPSMVPGPHTYTWLGLSDWQAELSVVDDGAWPTWASMTGDQISLRADAGDGVDLFGIAIVNDVAMSSYPGMTKTTVAMVGSGPLGQRGVRRSKVSAS